MYTDRDRAANKRLLIALAIAVGVIGLIVLAGVIGSSVRGGGTGRSDVAAPVASPVATATPPVDVPTSTPTTVAVVATQAPVEATRVLVVCIDAGHQAKSDNSLEPVGPGARERKPKVASGAQGIVTRNPEGLINLQVALRLRDELRARGVTVVMVRETQNVNISNSARAKIANDAHADLFIRLHCDGTNDRTQHGISTLVPVRNNWTVAIVDPSRKAGTLVQRAAVASTGAKDRGVVNRGDLSGFNWAKVPTVLVEMGFLSNAAEDRSLATPAYQKRLSTGIADGALAYLQGQ